MKTILLEVAEKLMRSPTAPYHEGAVSETLVDLCREHRLDCHTDRHGNVLVSVQTAPKKRPVVLAAHLDHPGFEIRARLGPGRWRAEFLGTVADRYFQPGLALRLEPGGMPATLGKRLSPTRQIFEIRAAAAPRKEPKESKGFKPLKPLKPLFAVWDLPEFEVRDDLVRGRACDDLMGTAVALTTLIELRRTRARVNVIGAFCRAEEVGFQGALALASGKELPREALLISLETSREIPPVKMGQGVIVRIGDRSSIFDSDSCRYLTEIASKMGGEGAKFPFQRALMSGGTCEATAYQEYGFRCGAVCVALGNYHNCAADGTIREEFISASDAAGMAELLVQAARRIDEFEALTGRLRARLSKLKAKALRRLAPRAKAGGRR